MRNLPRLKAAILALVLTLFCLAAIPTRAQSISGVVAGSVRDQQNQPLPGATITVANRETGRAYLASSDENGHYRVPEISPGSYDVTVQFPGMQTMKHVEVVVAVDEVTLEDFSMKIASKETTVEVKSTAPTTDTTDATLRYDFSTAQIQNLPILTRDINNLALLAPGTVSVRTFSFASTLVPFSTNGSRGRDNNFIIDSVDNNEPLFGGAATQFTNTDVFAEFTILTHQEDAEFGRNSGATVNVITKSGSNNLHGSGFWFGQDGIFNALNRAEKAAQLTSTPTSYENQAGATLGGPIKKDRSFYFLSYQWDRARDDLSRVFPVLSTLPDSSATGLGKLKSLPSTATLAAYLATPSVTTVQSQGGTCFTSPAPAGFNSTNPCLPTQPAVDGVTYNVYNVPRANVFDVRDNEASGRVDQKVGNRNDIYGRYLFDDLQTPNVPLSTAGDTAFSDLGLLPDARLLTRQRTQSAVIDHRFYGVKYLNELRFAYSRIAQGIGAFDEPVSVRNSQPAVTVEDEFSADGFGVYSNNFPSAGNRFTIGQNSTPSTFRSNIYQIQDNFSLIHGRNNFKFGADFVRTDSGLSSLSSNLGQYVFGLLGGSCDVAGAIGPGCTGGSPCTTNPEFCGFTDFVNNTPGTATVTFQRLTRGKGSLALRTYDEAVFFQDTVQLTHSLSVDAGIRYELFGSPINDLHNLYPTYAPSVDSYKKNFGPRFGFAWSPVQNVVVRGGYGIQYNPVIFDIALSMWQSGPISPLVVTTSAAGAGSIGEPKTIAQPTGTFPNAPLTTAALSVGVKSCGPDVNGTTPALGVTIAGSVPLGNCSSEFTVANTLRNPYVQNYSLGLQWEFKPSWLVEISGVGSKGTQLYLRQDQNPLGGWATNASGQPTNTTLCPTLAVNNLGCLNPRLDATHGDITAVTNAGDSTYNALQASLTKRYERSRAGDFTFTTSYTWSHMIDNASEIFGPTVQFLSAFVGANAVQNDFLSSFYLSPQAQGLQSIEAITPFAENPSNIKAEKASSSFDRRQRLSSSYLWEPFPTRGLALGGWQLNGIVSYQSGQPFSPLNAVPTGLCADANGDGILTNDRPAIGNPRAPLTSVALLTSTGCAIPPGPNGLTVANYSMDPANAHFVQTPLGLKPGQSFSVGSEQYKAESAGRNILFGPNLVEWDAALMKNFHFGESKVLQFRWEVYDALNHANPGFAIGNVFASNAQPTPAYAFSPSRTPASVTGVIPENAIDASVLTGTVRKNSFLTTQFMNTSSRTMQFGIKFTF
jgi:hypothetical protein